jgi:perosamine synthetase
MMNIPYSRHFIDQSDIDAVTEVLKSDWLTCGDKIPEFEQKICDYTGAKYTVAVSSGTAALHCALLTAHLQPKDEVIVPAITFAATANAVLYCGAKPVFADINPHTYNIDPQDIERKITNKTKAIIPVHMTGRPCEMDEIWTIAKKYNIIVIEDACHALGAKYRGNKIGNLQSEMTCFSLHPVKNITVGEGGLITTNSAIVAQYLREFRNHGRNKSGDQMHIGYNYRLTDFQAALGISQLNKIDDFWDKRCQIIIEYFAKLPENITPLTDNISYSSSWHLFVIQIPNRNKVKQYLNDHGIGAQIHYMPVYYHPYYQQLEYQKGLCPIAEDYYEHCLSLPCYVGLTQEQQNYVIKTLEEALNEFRV